MNPTRSFQSKAAHRVASLLVVGLLAASCVGVRPPAVERPAPGGRTAILVHVPAEPSWHDFACLAAVPAAVKANGGTPALIALPEPGAIPREVEDYLLRFKPQAVYRLAAPPPKAEVAPTGRRMLPADSADAAACLLARTFWTDSNAVVLCPPDDYSTALVASALAGRLQAPLLFAGPSGIPPATRRCIRELGAKEAIVVGKAPKAAAALARRLRVVELADAHAVLAWARDRKLPVRYLAAANPRDRTATVVRKLSLAAPMLAAARQGLVLPLDLEVLWKKGFDGKECPEDAPPGTPESKKPPRKGTLAVGGRQFLYTVTTGKGTLYLLAHIDLDGDGRFGKGEGPFRTGDVVTLAGTRCSLALGRRNGVGQADVRLTTPVADEIVGRLRAAYAALGGPPDHLCIVGFPDAIPMAVVQDNPGSKQDLPSDFPLANADADPFAELALGRVIAEDACFATLYASRVLTYADLLDPSWFPRTAYGRWENTYGPLFENVGFQPPFHHDVQHLKWKVAPAPGVKGKRARGFDQDSPAARSALLTHMAHSWWKDLGQTYTWDSTVLLAPVLVESGGCLTTALDREPDFRSVVARLLRNGAVGYTGNARPGIAYQEQLRAEFWNGVLGGLTIGQAHRRAANSNLVTMLETGQLGGGPNRYQLHIRGLFGDPGFAPRIPSPPRSAPAHTQVTDGLVSVHAPAAWWPVRIRVPEDWKKWKDKDLYVVRGAGTYPHRHWVGEGYDKEETYVNAEFRTARKVKAIEQVQTPPEPLGWAGKYAVDEHADGTRTYHWRVRLIDFDQAKGTILSKVDRLDYRIQFAD